jgi:hypothetical protein
MSIPSCESDVPSIELEQLRVSIVRNLVSVINVVVLVVMGQRLLHHCAVRRS